MIFALVLYLFWLVGLAESKLLWQTRLLFPAFPVLALGAAVACDQLKAFDLPQFSIRRFARLVIVLVLGMTAFQYVVSFAGSDTLMYLSGAETRDAFMVRNLGAYQTVVKYVNDRLPANSNILFLWEPRSYYVQRNVQPDVILDALAHLRWQYHDPDAIAAACDRSRFDRPTCGSGFQDVANFRRCVCAEVRRPTAVFKANNDHADLPAD